MQTQIVSAGRNLGQIAGLGLQRGGAEVRDGSGTVSPSQPYSARQKYCPLSERLGGKSFSPHKEGII